MEVTKEHKTFIIGGNFRGGTTATALILEQCGVYLGNRLGYTKEDKQFQNLFMGNATDTAALWALIQRRNERHDIWGFKYPGVHTRLRGIVHSFRNPHVILVLRDPLAVAISEEQRDLGIKNRGLVMDRTISYNSNMVKLAKELRCPVKLVSFERLLTRTKQTVAELMEFVGVPPEENGSLHFDICEKIKLVPEGQKAY